MIDDEKLLAQWNEHKMAAMSGLSDQHARAELNHKFHAGDKMAYSTSVQAGSRKVAVTFNNVKPFVDAVSGFMIQLRREPDYSAVDRDSERQQEFSEYLNGLSRYARANANLDTIESKQDREMLICGYAAVDTNVLYEMNPDGEVAAELVKYDDIFWDSNAAMPNLLDARFVFRRKTYSLEEAKQRFEGAKEQDFDSPESQDVTGYHYNPGGGPYTAAKVGLDVNTEDQVAVYYYQWWELQPYHRMPNPIYQMADQQQAAQIAALLERYVENLKTVEEDEYKVDSLFDFDPYAANLVMDSSLYLKIKNLFAEFGFRPRSQKFHKKCFYTAILSDRRVFKKFKSPDQQGFTIKFKTGCYNPVSKYWHALVDSLREPALYMNKSLTEILYVIASNSKGGVMYEESAVNDPTRFEQQYASTAAAIKVNDGALSGGKIQPKAQSALPSGYEAVYQMAAEAMSTVSGINKEFLGGSQNAAVSALLESQRINQAVAALADYFDSIGLYQVEHARLMITFLKILAQNSPGRLVSIIGQDGARKYEELNIDRFASEYEVSISEAPTTAQQKQQTTQIMIDFAERMAASGRDVYPMIIDYLPISNADKRRMQEALKPNPQEEALSAEKAAEAERLQAETQSVLLEAQKAQAMRNMAEAQAKLASIPKIEAEAQTEQAITVKTIAEAEQKVAENEALANIGATDVRIVL